MPSRPPALVVAALLLLATLPFAGCGDGTESKVPTAVALSSASVSLTAVGESERLTATVRDQDGAIIEQPSITWTSTNPAVAAVDDSGQVTATGGGTARIDATAGSASANADVTVVQTPAQLQKAGGDLQAANVGQALRTPISVRVLDANDAGIPGALVTFDVDPGRGTLADASATTGLDGIASTSLTLLASGTVQVTAAVAATALTATFTATGVSPFAIELQFISTPTSTQREALLAARDRWQSLITSELSDVALNALPGQCGEGSPAVNRTVDDLLILVNLGPIDGPGSVLGAAGPCFIRNVSKLTAMGVMQFDTDDLEVIEGAGLLQALILHEMGHVLGFGTLWTDLGLLADPAGVAGADPHFTGAQATIAFDADGGSGYARGLKVPVEDSGSAGTVNSHWRESVFGRELMTGFVDAGLNPLSRTTVGSLADLGYTVNLAGADAYTLLPGLRAFSGGRKFALADDLLRIPVRVVDDAGRIQRLVTP
ncbi:MAG: Ig-like domain-containing protein [Gemmatimonadota bacterium]|nr:Ig-like domain-containing protein [Gemmatimonadota bacterium]